MLFFFHHLSSHVGCFNQAMRNMERLYRDAAPADIAAVDPTCIICREEMTEAKMCGGHVLVYDSIALTATNFQLY